MKRLETDEHRIVFEVSKRERQLLRQVLSHYPLLPRAYYSEFADASRETDRDEEAVLEEALSDRRTENRQQLLTWFDAPGRFLPTAEGFRLRLEYGEIKWLLEVLNDVRVGSWLRLGSPNQGTLSHLEITNETAPFFWGMELCGFFQMILLEALDGDEPSC